MFRFKTQAGPFVFDAKKLAAALKGLFDLVDPAAMIRFGSAVMKYRL